MSRKPISPRVLATFALILATSGCHSRLGLEQGGDAATGDHDLAAPASGSAVLEREDISQLQVTSMHDLLQGRLPGVYVRSGRAGQLMIQIRGRSSMRVESEALIMVDGIESNATTLLAMSPRDVQRVEVLKDGSAAIYGVRGANGVLLITTRRQGQ